MTAAEPTGDVREQIAEAVATAGDGYWARADAVLALPAVRDALAAQQTAERRGYERGKRETAEYLLRVAEAARSLAGES